jgi:myo-inositol-1(or 4)-monophosphatase
MTDWLAFSRDCTRGVEEALRSLPSRREREPVTGDGEGGDQTTAIDAAAEAAVVTRLESLGVDAVLVSEELGVRSIGAGGALHVVVDPIDGSVNCKRGIPYFALSIAVADGDTVDDVRFAYVADLATGEEWTAERGVGAFLGGAPLVELPKGRVEILAFEGTTTSSIAARAGAMVGVADRLRVMGSLALSLCHLAAGRVDAVCSLKPARSIDIAAAQLLVRERGLAIELFEDDRPFGRAPLDLAQRSRLVAAATPGLCAQVAAALSS